MEGFADCMICNFRYSRVLRFINSDIYIIYLLSRYKSGDIIPGKAVDSDQLYS